MPVEITDFCWKYNLQRLQNLPEVKGCEAKLRHNADGTPYVTDNKNYIVDLYFKTPIKVNRLHDPEPRKVHDWCPLRHQHGIQASDCVATSVPMRGQTVDKQL
jgi:hypothetical protein